MAAQGNARITERRQAVLARVVAYRQLSIIFNPWETGHTTCSVVTVDYRGDKRVVHRVGSIDLAVGRLDLVGLSASAVTALLVNELQEWLSQERHTLLPAKRVGAPLGATGGTVTQVPGQQTLDLDLTV